MLRHAKEFIEKHEGRLSGIAFVAGFLWDNLTLTRVDRLYDNLLLAAYLAIAFAGIALLNTHRARGFQSSLARRVVVVACYSLPFAFGGLFSGLLIFYSRSGPLLASAPFLLILAAFLFGNEFLRKHYQRFVFQMSVFFVALFSYVALITPIALGTMGGAVFLLSGIAALALFWLAVKALSLLAREKVLSSHSTLWTVITCIFVTLNFLYFNNLIPPVPLSLKSIGAYHAIGRERNGAYSATFEAPAWYALHRDTATVFHRMDREHAAVFSSVYAPAGLVTEVAHRWEYRDEGTGKWLLVNIIRFPISGGRQEGYRGYSRKENIQPGRWRVSVETLRGQIIGRFTFTVTDAATAPLLTEAAL